MVHQTSLFDAWSLKPGSAYSRAAFASHTATDVADAATCRGLLLSCIPSTLWGTTTMASQEGLEPPTLGFGDRCATSCATDSLPGRGGRDRTYAMSGSKPDALPLGDSPSIEMHSLECALIAGGSWQIRTADQQIKSLLLYHLS